MSVIIVRRLGEKGIKDEKQEIHYSNPDAIKKVVNYIHRGVIKLPEDEQIWGVFGTICQDDPQEIIEEIMKSKRKMEHTEGRQCNHWIISFGAKPDLTKRQLEKMMAKLAGYFKTKYTVFYGVHNRDQHDQGYHLHIMISLTNYINGKKGDITKHEMARYKKAVKNIVEKRTGIKINKVMDSRE